MNFAIYFATFSPNQFKNNSQKICTKENIKQEKSQKVYKFKQIAERILQRKILVH